MCIRDRCFFLFKSEAFKEEQTASYDRIPQEQIAPVHRQNLLQNYRKTPAQFILWGRIIAVPPQLWSFQAPHLIYLFTVI